MFLMSEDDLKLILMGLKWYTMRGLRDNGVYFKLHSLQWLKLSLFDEGVIRVKITSREFVDLNEMSVSDFNGVGYSREEYLSQSYNQKNYFP